MRASKNEVLDATGKTLGMYTRKSYATEGPMIFQTASGNLKPPSTYMYGFQPLTTTISPQLQPTKTSNHLQPVQKLENTQADLSSIPGYPTTPSQSTIIDRNRRGRSLASMIYYFITRPVVRLVRGS